MTYLCCAVAATAHLHRDPVPAAARRDADPIAGTCPHGRTHQSRADPSAEGHGVQGEAGRSSTDATPLEW